MFCNQQQDLSLPTHIMNSVKKASTQNQQPIRPSIVIVKPSGCLDSITCHAFRKALDQAFELATDTVVVDLLLVSTIKTEGIKTLLAGMKKAAALGKNISLENLDLATQEVIESAWNYRY